MKPNTLTTPNKKEIHQRRVRQRIEAVLALLLFVCIAVFGLAGISLANGNTKAIIYICISLAGTIPAIIYLNKEEAK